MYFPKHNFIYFKFTRVLVNHFVQLPKAKIYYYKINDLIIFLSLEMVNQENFNAEKIKLKPIVSFIKEKSSCVHLLEA